MSSWAPIESSMRSVSPAWPSSSSPWPAMTPAHLRRVTYDFAHNRFNKWRQPRRLSLRYSLGGRSGLAAVEPHLRQPPNPANAGFRSSLARQITKERLAIRTAPALQATPFVDLDRLLGVIRRKLGVEQIALRSLRALTLAFGLVAAIYLASWLLHWPV